MAKDFKIQKTMGTCQACQEQIPAGEDIVALVKTGPEELVREDYHLQCWVEPLEKQADESDDVIGVWRTRIPYKEEKKKLLVDDELLKSFFIKLEDTQNPTQINFRYVLTLILMRKRILAYEGSKTQDNQDIWKLRIRGTKNYYNVIDPKMDEEKIADVSQSLGEIMQGDFE